MSEYGPLRLLIDGEWIEKGRRNSSVVVNPATGRSIGEAPHATMADLDRALEAAKKGFETWRRVSPYDRAKVLRKAAALIRERVGEIGRRLTVEQGKPLAEAQAEVLVAADHFDWHAEEGRRAYGRIIPGRLENQRLMVLREPVGPVAAFTPWNFPANMPGRKISTALAAGCSIVIKPAEETPGTALDLAQALQDAGLPNGVLNVVFGVPSEVSTHLIGSDVIRKVSFTGSTAVGRLIAGLAAQGLKKTTLELGGHAPVVVFDDVDVDRTVDLCVPAKYRNAGQVCVSATRFFVQDAIHGDFAAKFAHKAAQLKVGDGLQPGVQMGPTANPRRQDAMQDFVRDAVDKGAKLLAGGERIGNEGFFWQPTVLADVPPDARIMSVEPFGPIAIINKFGSFDDVVEKANSLPYGLAAYAFTTSDRRATLIENALETGMVAVNSFNVTYSETPFGGVKDSGWGSEGGTEGLDGHLVTKFVSRQ